MSAGTEPLQVLTVPLSGMQLVEAAAGTGKTWTVTGLYVRLVLEQAVPVDRILVVTYTTAATEELRDRIRARLVQARAAFTRGVSEDPFCAELLARWPRPEEAVHRLSRAILGFDEAAIFTIHGFCQRVLAESAFESGMPFETDILTDQGELLQEVVDDFWRREVYGAESLFVQHLLDTCPNPGALTEIIRSYTGKPYLRITAPEPRRDWTALAHRYREAYTEVYGLWRRCRNEIAELLLHHSDLKRTRYKRDKIPGWIVGMDAFLATQSPNLRKFDALERFTSHSLDESVKKGGVSPAHPFFSACETLFELRAELSACFDVHLAALKARALQYVDEQLRDRKAVRQLQSYDDLLTNLRRALAADSGARLVQKLREDYQAALIDEFQDTDPTQYDIFRRIYASTSQPVFLVGDPKQAIYSFRGADIFAYLNGRKAAQRRYTLDVNWRSVPELITAVNTLFRQETPFVFDAIDFYDARAADTNHRRFTAGGEIPPPMTIWLLERDDTAKPITKDRATRSCAFATASEIARLLAGARRGEVSIGDAALRPGDIAVLVRSHRQGRLVRDALLDIGVPSVQHAQDNVFHSWEAMELERVLMAVAEPGHEALVKAALVTDMLGMKADALSGLMEHGEAWDRRLEIFHSYHRTWREHGFIRMLRGLMAGEDVTTRLLKYQDGERRLTNLLHLAELLQETVSRAGLGIEALVRWFADMRHTDAREEERAQLRLESDADRVKIVTVHKSKGLQYPVVFCPFMWDGKIGATTAKQVLFHDPDCGLDVTLDFGSEHFADHVQRAREEELAENLRLLYVALTRARCRCYLMWGATNDAGTSPLAWLFHRPNNLPEHNLLDSLKEHFNKLSDSDIRARLEALAQRASGAISVVSLPEEVVPTYVLEPVLPSGLAARTFAGRIETGWRVSSFSALTTGHETEAPDHDAYARHESGVAPSARDMFCFPRGARAGTCLHDIFEHLDFTRKDPDHVAQTVRRKLTEHGFGESWLPAVADMVSRVLATSLDERGQVRLAQVGHDQRINELEFYYPVADLQDTALRSLLAAHGFGGDSPMREQMGRLVFSPLRGFMHGFIDLVFETDGRFYLADYKSNWLGMAYQDYGDGYLTEVMARESYYLQYLIYTVAVHRYLKQRLVDYDYGKHFGGVFYLFVRGMHPDKGPHCGVYRDRPACALIEALDAYLASAAWSG